MMVCHQLSTLLMWMLFTIYSIASLELGNNDFPNKEKYDNLLNQKPYHWKDILHYYYPTLQHKVDAMLHYGCKTSNRILPANSAITIPPDRDSVYIIPFPPWQDIETFWYNIPPPKQMRVDPFLCEAVYVKKRPIFNNTGCQLPHYMSPGAPRCQTSLLKWICDQSKLPIDNPTPNGFFLPESQHSTWIKPPLPWILTIRESLVTMCGQIISKCGLIHTNANCMSTGQRSLSQQFYKRCPISIMEKYMNSKLIAEGVNNSCPNAPFGDIIHHYDRVFVVAEVDDTYIYHIHLEIVPRIVQHLQFLRDNSDIKILIGCDTKDKKRGNKDGSLTASGLQAGIKAMKLMMDLFNFPMSRFIVHQNIFAREIYLPMEGACQDPVYNTWQILSMRNRILTMLKIPTGYRHFVQGNDLPRTNDDYDISSAQFHGKRPVMLLMKRSADSQHTRNRFDLVRQWSDSFTSSLMEVLSSAFPQYELKLYSDRDEKIMDCFECQIRLVAEADVLIGVHGAGLGMSLYMPPNKAVVEFAPYGNDGRCLLGGGPFSRLATVLGHNYMMHHPPYEEFKWIGGKSSEFNITRFVIHINSFLRSIGQI